MDDNTRENSIPPARSIQPFGPSKKSNLLLVMFRVSRPDFPGCRHAGFLVNNDHADSRSPEKAGCEHPKITPHWKLVMRCRSPVKLAVIAAFTSMGSTSGPIPYA